MVGLSTVRMNEKPLTSPPAELRDLAGQLLEHETGERHDAEALADATERSCQKLCQRAATLVGVEGCRALLARALHLVKIEHPFLAQVQVDAESVGRLPGVRESAQAAEYGRAAGGLTAVVAYFIWLLATFIGEDLALRVVHDVWPDVPLAGTSSGFEEATS